MKTRYRYLFAVVLVALFLLSIALLIAVLFFPKPSGRIKAYFHLYAEHQKPVLASLIDDFDRSYPEVEIDTAILPYLDMKRQLFGENGSGVMTGRASSSSSIPSLNEDQPLEEGYAVVTALVATDIPEDAEVSPGYWIGNEWRLFYNVDVAAGLGLDQGELEELAAGSFNSFVRDLKEVVEKSGFTGPLFSVGSRFFLPWLSWLQHLYLEEHRGRMPDGFSAEAWRPALERFDQLLSSGVVNRDHLSINQAGSALRMFRGEALFLLSTDQIYEVFLPRDRARIRSIPFPGSSSSNWVVGSGFSLTTSFILPQGEEKVPRALRAAADRFIAYLRSGEAAEMMLSEAGVPLYPESPIFGRREVPSITHQASAPALRELRQLR